MVLSLKDTSSRFKRGREALNNRRQAWGAFEALARATFERATRQGAIYEFPDRLYISSSSEHTSTTSQPWIRLFFGRRAVGSLDECNFISEGGCALQLSQGPRGEVVAFVFPFTSETHADSDEYLVISSLRDPRHGTKEWIQSRIAQLLSYALHTSVEGECSRRDSLKVAWMRFRHKCFGRSVSSIVGDPLMKGLRLARHLKGIT